MQAPAVLHWPQDRARVQDALQRGQTVVLCVTRLAQEERSAARQAVRTALQTALGAWLGCPPPTVRLYSLPGTPICIQHPATPAVLSISHEAGLSLAAIAPHGAVGVDILHTTSLPGPADCLRLAREYLGPTTMQQLATRPEAERQGAFAQAWAVWEARLKCAGLGLREWEPALEDELHLQVVEALPLPGHYCGALAWRQAPASHRDRPSSASSRTGC